jgi:Protein of unknown function (DUF3352)
MRRLGVLVVFAALVLAGCGSSSSSGSANPVNTELSYFPSGSVFVMSVATDPNSAAVKQMHGLIARFPIASFGQSALMAKLDQLGIDYQSDIRPLFGNPIALGLATATPTANLGGAVLAAWVTKDAGKLTALIKKVPGVHTAGSHAGATLYSLGGPVTVAVDGTTAVLGTSAASVDSALDRHAQGGGITSGQYAKAFTGLPQNGLVQAFGNLSGVLSKPSAAKARLVPWVAAFRGYAATIGASPTGLTINYRLDTTGGSLSAAQLPFATGTGTPKLAGRMPITVGIEDPAQIASFVESAQQSTSPASYAKFAKHQAALRAKTGVDLNSLLRLLTGELIVASDTHTTMGRAALSDPASATQILSELVTAPRSAFNNTKSIARLSGGFYAIKDPHQTINIGIVGNQLVLGKASVAQLRAFAATPTVPATGAQGSVAFRVALVQLLHLALRQAPPKVAQTILSSLGDITGWVAAAPSGITGSASLAVR